MKERPILFSASMVRAILDGRKTQTRRVVKPQPTIEDGRYFWNRTGWSASGPEQLLATTLNHTIERDGSTGGLDFCPYGQPGDRLWVRETVWLPRPVTARDLREGADTWPKCIYSADTDATEIEWMREHRWKQHPSIHMPRSARKEWLPIGRSREESRQFTWPNCSRRRERLSRQTGKENLSARQAKRYHKAIRRRDKLLAYRPNLPQDFSFHSDISDFGTRIAICVQRDGDGLRYGCWLPRDRLYRSRFVSTATIDRGAKMCLVAFEQADRDRENSAKFPIGLSS